jgi:predicted nucleic acid-binding protein
MRAENKELNPLSIDASALIYQLTKELSLKAGGQIIDAAERKELYMSVVAVSQVKAGLKTHMAKKLFESFLEFVQVEGFTVNLVDEVVKLRTMYDLKLVDAVIAATALAHGGCLMSNDTPVFSKIEGIEHIPLS